MPFNLFLSFGLKYSPKLSTIGITNETEDRKFILFADYDNCNLEAVEKDALFLQKNFKIGNLIILASSPNYTNELGKIYGNYHIIGFTKLEFPELLEILSYLRCHFHFKRGWKYQYRNWVLRVSDKLDNDGKTIKTKPTLISVLPSKTNREYSYAHIEFFKKNYNFELSNIKPLVNTDLHEDVQMIRYVTR